jgi:cell shape-determining protein MreC
MMAAIFLVLAVLDAVLLGNILLANTSASSVSVFDQSMTGFTQGQLLLLAAGLGLLLALFLRLAGSSSSARRAKRRQLRAARREVEGRVAELERENARLRKELEGTRHPGALVGPQGGLRRDLVASQPPQVDAHAKVRSPAAT